MTLDEAFGYRITANTKGLQRLRSDLNTIADDMKQSTEKGDLAALKTSIADLRGKVVQFQAFVKKIEERAAQLTVDEKGQILDLSVPHDRRT